MTSWAFDEEAVDTQRGKLEIARGLAYGVAFVAAALGIMWGAATVLAPYF